MKYRKLTESGDYSFGNNSKDYYDDNNAIAQAIKTKILLFYGEWWENLGIGIPMFQSIVGKTNSKNIALSIKSILEKRIMEIEEVKAINEISTTIEERKLNVYIRCTVSNGSNVSVEVNI